MSLLAAIVPHQCCDLSSSELEFAEQTAAEMLRDHWMLRSEPLFRELVPNALRDLKSLHVDDYTEVQNARPERHVFFQERARLRASADDLLVTALPQVEGYENYCREYLGLGPVCWIQPACGSNPLRVAEACWKDRAARRELVRQIRIGGLRYIHPHMGSRAIWNLALLLRDSSHRPLEVIAPPPGLAHFVNDKGAFNSLVTKMFGVQATPRHSVTWNCATAAKRLRELATTNVRMVAIKLASAAGGEGNVLIPTDEIRDRKLHEIDALLDTRLPDVHYQSGSKLVISQWVEEIVAAPSAQLWIPPTAQGKPVVEGLFVQLIEGAQGHFCGFHSAELPCRLEMQMTQQALLLARVFQLLGYVGRCSFDMLMVGPELENAELQFIECNGRWGGTSLPMTFMNQLFGDWMTQPFSTRLMHVPGLSDVSFEDQLRSLDERLFRYQEFRGWSDGKVWRGPSDRVVLYNPQRTGLRSEVSMLALHPCWETTRTVFDDCAQTLSHAVATGTVARASSNLIDSETGG